MTNQVFTNITVPMDTAFSVCAQPLADKWVDCSYLEKINRKDGYTGEYRKVVQGDNVAAFASPSFDACDALPADKVDTCKIELKFNQEQVDWLEQRIPTIVDTNPPLSANSIVSDQNSLSNSDPSDASTSSEQPAECTSLLGCSSAFVATNWLPLLSALVVVFLLMLFKDNLYRLIFADDRTKRSNQPRRASSTGSTPPSFSLFDSLESSNITYRLDSISQKLKSVDSKLSDIEMRLLDLEQRSVSNPSLSFFGQSGIVAPSSGALQNLQPVPSTVAPLPSLSIDVVKQAVAQADYSLISLHSHLFLNETQESRQGKFERRRFDVLGDQSQASSFANAEFIAISVESQAFLIPNILPNAADPRRTMKRHVDSNSIYRAGAGSNILKIDKLAILQQLSSSSYELAELGLIE